MHGLLCQPGYTQGNCTFGNRSKRQKVPSQEILQGRANTTITQLQFKNRLKNKHILDKQTYKQTLQIEKDMHKIRKTDNYRREEKLH